MSKKTPPRLMYPKLTNKSVALHPELRSFYELLERSTTLENGCKAFSRATLPLVHMIVNKWPGLFVVDIDNMLINYSDEGTVLRKWSQHVPK